MCKLKKRIQSILNWIQQLNTTFDLSKKSLLISLWIRNDFFGSGSYFSVGYGFYMNFF
jgi:hypothetical protein